MARRKNYLLPDSSDQGVGREFSPLLVLEPAPRTQLDSEQDPLPTPAQVSFDYLYLYLCFNLYLYLILFQLLHRPSCHLWLFDIFWVGRSNMCDRVKVWIYISEPAGCSRHCSYIVANLISSAHSIEDSSGKSLL